MPEVRRVGYLQLNFISTYFLLFKLFVGLIKTSFFLRIAYLANLVTFP